MGRRLLASVFQCVTMKRTGQTLLWWGRSDPAYSRNAIVLQVLRELGWTVSFFHPRSSALGDLEARLKKTPGPAAVWVPCFRQRDFFAAHRFARRTGVPLIFDPLISAYDKRVFEFEKIKPGSKKAGRLRQREQNMFSSADIVLADTIAHKAFFEQELGASPERCFVVPVGADPEVFTPQPFHGPGTPPEAFFYGSFLPLHGVETIIAAARLCPEIRWTLLGGGALRSRCEELAEGVPNVRLESPVAYAQLPDRIGQADVVLGVFGTTPKAGRVIPNKVFQAMACARPVVTRESPAYPSEIRNGNGGITFVPPGDPQALVDRVRALIQSEADLKTAGETAYKTSDRLFSLSRIRSLLRDALNTSGLFPNAKEAR